MEAGEECHDVGGSIAPPVPTADAALREFAKRYMRGSVATLW